MIKAIVIDNQYPNLKIGSIHDVSMITLEYIYLADDPRRYIRSNFSPFDENGKVQWKDAMREDRLKRNGK